MDVKQDSSLPSSDTYLEKLSREELVEEINHLQQMVKIYQQASQAEIDSLKAQSLKTFSDH